MQTFGISLPDNQVKDDESVVRTFEEMRSKISSIPGVSAVTLSTAFPMDGRSSADVLFAEDHPLPEGQIPPIRRMIYVIPGFFSADGTPLVAGRDFTWTDLYQKLPVAIISENFAREYWDSPSAALGKRIRIASTDD